MITIYQNAPKLIKNLLLAAVILPAISFAKPVFEMKNPKGETITLRLATTREEHSRGLSGTKPSEFSTKEGMLFVNETMGTRRFWMPETLFNLDIIFLDSNLKIVGIEKNVPMHPGKTEPPAIYRTKTYQAQFILETKAQASFSKNLKNGDELKFSGPSSLSEIVLKTRQQQ